MCYSTWIRRGKAQEVQRAQQCSVKETDGTHQRSVQEAVIFIQGVMSQQRSGRTGVNLDEVRDEAEVCADENDNKISLHRSLTTTVLAGRNTRVL